LVRSYGSVVVGVFAVVFPIVAALEGAGAREGTDITFYTGGGAFGASARIKNSCRAC